MPHRIETPQIYADLHQRLSTGQLAPGEKLKPLALQADYGCSANTVREALLLLSKDGLVTFELQRGFRVPLASAQRCHDLVTFRILLEQEGASMSIESGDLDWEAKLTAAHHQLGHIQNRVVRNADFDKNGRLWASAEEAFHQTLISASGMPVLMETHARVYVQFRQHMVGLDSTMGKRFFAANLAEHQAILDAALARDAEGCRRAIHTHLKRHLLDAGPAEAPAPRAPTTAPSF